MICAEAGAGDAVAEAVVADADPPGGVVARFPALLLHAAVITSNTHIAAAID
jgi:hypothetical protein